MKEDVLFQSLLLGNDWKLEPGRTHIIKERRPELAVDCFIQLLERGYEGLYITRQHPDHIEQAYRMRGSRIIWLSTMLGKDHIDPHNLSSLTNLICNFLNDSGARVVALDGLEYLVVNNDFDRVLRFVECVSEAAANKGTVLLISVDERAFEEREMAFIEKNSNSLLPKPN